MMYSAIAAPQKTWLQNAAGEEGFRYGPLMLAGLGTIGARQSGRAHTQTGLLAPGGPGADRMSVDAQTLP
jgi:hypothetical protein